MANHISLLSLSVILVMIIAICGAFPATQPLVRIRRQESLLGELIEGIGEGIGEALVGGNRRPYGGYNNGGYYNQQPYYNQGYNQGYYNQPYY